MSKIKDIFTPFFPICIGITLSIKKVMQKKKKQFEHIKITKAE